jgi:putative ABC transport system permease protein
MDWRESLRQAYESVSDHPRRVFASSMGVLWGAAAIVVLLGWGTGFREFMRVELGRFGEGFVMLFPATTSSGFPGFRKGVHLRISRDDAAAAERDAGESVRALLACHNSRERLLVESDVGQIRRLDLSACDERFLALRKFEIEHGRGFDAAEAERGAAVAVLGPEAAEQLFGSPEAALGRTLRVSGKPFQVIGVPKRKGRQYFNTHRPDNRMLVIPAASAEERLGYDPQAANFFLLFPRRGRGADDAARAVLRAWGPRAGFHPDDADAIKRFSSYELLGLVDLFYAGFMIFIGVAGTVTLLIGGVGIANVHLATLAERTVEIGVAKAIGARNRVLVVQTIVESLLVSGSTAGLGALLGVALCWALGAFTDPSVFPRPILSAVGVAVTFAAVLAVALVAALLPALQVRRMDVSAALRAET